MSSSHECPFCKVKLRKSEGFIDRKNNIKHNFNHYFCDETPCMNDDMSRYSVNYAWGSNKKDGEKTSCNFMIDTYYIQIDWEENTSILSTLDGPVLLGSITLPKALDLDMTDLASVVKRIKTLLVFS
jgi:hypothetical protein